MSTKFYKYVYDRQNYAKYNRYLMLANKCTVEGKNELYELELQEWEEWVKAYEENPDIIPPPPERPVAPVTSDSLVTTETDDCKKAYANLVRKQKLNPNSIQMSTNMRSSYFLRNQYRVPLLTAWY